MHQLHDRYYLVSVVSTLCLREVVRKVATEVFLREVERASKWSAGLLGDSEREYSDPMVAIDAKAKERAPTAYVEHGKRAHVDMNRRHVYIIMLVLECSMVHGAEGVADALHSLHAYSNSFLFSELTRV